VTTRGAAVEAPAGRRDAGLGWPVWRLALVIVFGAFASGLDASIVTIGLPAIGRDLRAALPETQWVATAYLLALAVSLPLAGWLGRRIGVGRLWLAALAAFTAASVLCAAAPTLAALIALRAAQGLAGGLLIPAGQTVLGQAVGAHRLGRVMATLGVAVSVAPALGPVVGGLLLDTATWPGLAAWRWLFAVNLPVGAVGLLLGLRYVPRGRRGRRGAAGPASAESGSAGPGAAGPLDWRSLGLVSVGLPLTVYGLTALAGREPVGRVVVPLVVGAVALVVFAVRGRRVADPLVDLGLLRDGVFAAATVTAGFGGAVMFGSGLLVPLYLQLGHGWSPRASGLHLLGLGGATAVALPVVGRLVDRYGGGPVAVAGAALVTACTVPFAVLPVTVDVLVVHALLAPLGAAIALAAVPPGVAAYQAVPPGKLPDATTIVNIVQRIGGALGGAAFTLVLAAAGFHAAFWAMAGAGAAALVAATWLAVASRRDR
jgi:EmrB/QacA subfamily drug resistance transporter